MSRFGNRSRLLGSGASARVAQWTQRSLIKSIQRGTITVSAAQLTGTATITAVDTASSVLYLLGYSATGSSGAEWRDYACRVSVTNSTTITATRPTATEVDSVLLVSFEVVEYVPGVVKQVQRGTITNTGTTATITAVNTTKSVLMTLGYEYNGASSFAAWLQGLPKVVLTNSTTVTATSGGSTFVVGYQVVEFF